VLYGIPRGLPTANLFVPVRPQIQRWMLRLKAYEYCGYLRTWIKQAIDQQQIDMECLHTSLSRERRYLFSGSKVSFNPKDCYRFATPLYVLHNAMAAGKKLDKWSADQSGSILGKVLAACKDRRPGPVSHDRSHLSQFHVKFDPTFQKMRKSFDN
jgi:hypothetical protein